MMNGTGDALTEIERDEREELVELTAASCGILVLAAPNGDALCAVCAASGYFASSIPHRPDCVLGRAIERQRRREQRIA
jgi:hypothetical protein